MIQGRQHMWIDLPDLAIALRAHLSGQYCSENGFLGAGAKLLDLLTSHFSEPTTSQSEPITKRSVQRWLNFNEFEARLMESDVTGAFHDAMWALQLALEEDLPASTEESTEEPAADCRLLAASIWISRCAKNFYEWAQENPDLDTAGPETYQFKGGPLYRGRPTMCPERWEFWQHRLELLGAPESGLMPQTREAVHRAAEAMRTVTTGVSSSEAS